MAPRRGGKGGRDVCRDFLRNTCNRFDKCKFLHQKPEEKDHLLQKEIVFCHDYQNLNDCNRSQCKFLHGSKEDEEEFMRSGYMPPHLRQQAIGKGIAADLPTVFGRVPICKDYLSSVCRRKNCRFRHLTSREYDLELSQGIESIANERGQDEPFSGFNRLNQLSVGAHENFDEQRQQRRAADGRGDDASSARGGGKRRRMNNSASGELNCSTGNDDFYPEVQMLQHENMILKQQLQELKKQVFDLSTTNNFLLEQNAQLRLSMKAEAAQAAVQSSQQANKVVETPMSLPLPVLVTTMTGSSLVNSISMANSQPAATLVTSMSLEPTLESAQPLTLETLSELPTVSTIHAVSQALPPPPQTISIAPNQVQVHETHLVSYPIMSVRPPL